MKGAENLDNYEKQKLKEISEFLGEEKGQSKFLYPKFTEWEVQASPNFVYFKTILFIGQTGAGKTTSINYFLNFFLGVKFKDNFRFLLINEKTVSGTQAVSQIQDVSIYYVKPYNGNPALRIIDTPGLGDTRGLQQDKINIDKITSLFQNQIDTITTICFVVKASDNRLVESFNLIIEAFLNMFGKNIVKIFVCLITHWDGIEEEPNAIQTLSFQGDLNNRGCHISSLISQIQEPWYFLINNSPFQSKLKTKYFKAAWKDSIDTFNDFFEQKVANRQDASLMMTKEVLKHKTFIEQKLQEYRKNLRYRLDQLSNIRKIFNSLQDLELQIVTSQKINRNKTLFCKTQFETGFWVMNCDCCQKKYTKSYKKKILLEKLNEYFTELANLIYELEDFLFKQKKLNIKIQGIRSPKNESDLTYLDSLLREEQQSKEIDSSKALKTFSNLLICLKFIKNDLNYQFDEQINNKLLCFKQRSAWKIEEAYEKKLFSII